MSFSLLPVTETVSAVGLVKGISRSTTELLELLHWPKTTVYSPTRSPSISVPSPSPGGTNNGCQDESGTFFVDSEAGEAKRLT
jgi:hypothetical protein